MIKVLSTDLLMASLENWSFGDYFKAEAMYVGVSTEAFFCSN